MSREISRRRALGALLGLTVAGPVLFAASCAPKKNTPEAVFQRDIVSAFSKTPATILTIERKGLSTPVVDTNPIPDTKGLDSGTLRVVFGKNTRELQNVLFCAKLPLSVVEDEDQSPTAYLLDKEGNALGPHGMYGSRVEAQSVVKLSNDNSKNTAIGVWQAQMTIPQIDRLSFVLIGTKIGSSNRSGAITPGAKLAIAWPQ